jgi:hypothetical protein
MSGEETDMTPEEKSQKEQELKLRIQKLLSGEIKPSSEPVTFLSIAEQKRLGIPTDSITTTFNPLKRDATMSTSKKKLGKKLPGESPDTSAPIIETSSQPMHPQETYSQMSRRINWGGCNSVSNSASSKTGTDRYIAGTVPDPNHPPSAAVWELFAEMMRDRQAGASSIPPRASDSGAK